MHMSHFESLERGEKWCKTVPFIYRNRFVHGFGSLIGIKKYFMISVLHNFYNKYIN